MDDPRQNHPQTREERIREEWETMEKLEIADLHREEQDYFAIAAELARKEARRVKAEKKHGL